MTWQAKRDVALLTLEGSADPRLRLEAAKILRELASQHEEAWTQLAPAIPTLAADAHGPVRRAAAGLAGLVLPPEQAEPVLARLLADPDEEVRMEAAGQLADQRRGENRPLLAPALQDPSLRVRFEAARGLASLGHKAGLEVLVEALGHDDLRFRALGALGELGDPAALPALKRTFRRWLLPAFEKTQAAGALARLGDSAGAAHLHARAKGRWTPDRGLALELLGEVKAAGAYERLLAVLEDPKDPFRGAAARALGRLGDPRALAPLAELLEGAHAPEELKLDAVEGLCRLGLPEAVGRVQRALAVFSSEEARLEVLGMLEETA